MSQHAISTYQVHAQCQLSLYLNTDHAAAQDTANAETAAVDKMSPAVASHLDARGAWSL
ncbi:MAG: hypothetical protein VX262_03645 [Acidobacteriota bacterium]|nr:hypothetical protein [Acidobacteriota bacterium]